MRAVSALLLAVCLASSSGARIPGRGLAYASARAMTAEGDSQVAGHEIASDVQLESAENAARYALMGTAPDRTRSAVATHYRSGVVVELYIAGLRDRDVLDLETPGETSARARILAYARALCGGACEFLDDPLVILSVRRVSAAEEAAEPVPRAEHASARALPSFSRHAICRETESAVARVFVPGFDPLSLRLLLSEALAQPPPIHWTCAHAIPERSRVSYFTSREGAEWRLARALVDSHGARAADVVPWDAGAEGREAAVEAEEAVASQEATGEEAAAATSDGVLRVADAAAEESRGDDQAHAHAAHERSLAQAGRVPNSSFMVHPETLADGLASPPTSPPPSPFTRSPWDVRVPHILIHSADVQVQAESVDEENVISVDSPPATAPPLRGFLPSCRLIVKDATCCASSGLRVSRAAFEVALRCPHPMPRFPPGCLEASDLGTGGYLSARIETESWGVGDSGAEDDASEGADSDRASATQTHVGGEVAVSPGPDSRPLLAISAFGVQVYPLAFQNYLLHAQPLVVRLAWGSHDEACSLDVDATQGCEAFSLAPWLDFDSPSPAKSLCALRPAPLHLLVGPAEWEERQAAALAVAMGASGVKVYDMAALSPEEVQLGRCSCGCPTLDRKRAQADAQAYDDDEVPAFVANEGAANEAVAPPAPGRALPECMCVCQPVAGATIDAPTLLVDVPAAPGGEGADRDWMLPPQPLAVSKLPELGAAPGDLEVHWGAAAMAWLNNNGTCAMTVADDILAEYWRGGGEELEGFEEDC